MRSVMGNRSATGGQTSNVTPSGAPQGTMGGSQRAAAGVATPGGKLLGLVDEVTYLWVLVGLEVGALVYMRKHFRRFHGG